MRELYSNLPKKQCVNGYLEKQKLETKNSMDVWVFLNAEKQLALMVLVECDLYWQ